LDDIHIFPESCRFQVEENQSVSHFSLETSWLYFFYQNEL
jgi:hypothetical protein